MDNVNTIGDFTRSVFSTLVNKDDDIFKALFASDEENEHGTVEKIFQDLEETRNKWCNTHNMYEQEGEMLEKTLSFFSVLNRIFNESDKALKERNRLLYVRNGDKVWGDRWDIVRMFKDYFQTDFVYIVNNTNEARENLLQDGDFEGNTGAWVFDRCGADHEARFSERNGVKFENYGKCSQTVGNLEKNETYFVHFFHNRNIEIEIKDNNGRYWKPASIYVDGFGSWTNQEHKIKITGSPDKWEPGSVFFITDDSVTGVTVSFFGIAGESAYLDYVRLFKKEAYSTFTLIVVFGGLYTPDTLGLAPGTEDPITARNYEGYRHYTEGKNDADKNYDNASFIEASAVNEDKTPVLSGGNDDPEKENNIPNDGYIEDAPLAPWMDDKTGITVDYSKMSYIEHAHLFGTDGVQQKNIYTELLEIVQAGGIPSYIEILVRELDE